MTLASGEFSTSSASVARSSFVVRHRSSPTPPPSTQPTRRQYRTPLSHGSSSSPRTGPGLSRHILRSSTISAKSTPRARRLPSIYPPTGAPLLPLLPFLYPPPHPLPLAHHSRTPRRSCLYPLSSPPAPRLVPTRVRAICALPQWTLLLQTAGQLGGIQGHGCQTGARVGGDDRTEAHQALGDVEERG